MSATILTPADTARFCCLVFLILALIPFLAGIVARILIAGPFLGGLLGATLGLVLATIKLARIGFRWDQPLLEILPGIAFFVVIVSGFSTAGVLSASAFYAGYHKAIETEHKESRDSTS
jgi:hypothetical protein